MGNRIVIDTLGWYNLGDGSLNYISFGSNKLIGTYYNALELASTPNNFSALTFAKIKNTAHAFYDFNYEILEVDFVDYILSVSGIKYTFNKENWDTCRIYLEFLLSFEKNKIPDDNILSKYRYITAKARAPFIDLADYFNRYLIVYREKIKMATSAEKKQILNADKEDFVKTEIIKFINIKQNSSLQMSQINWGEIDFFVKLVTEYFHKVITSEINRIKKGKEVESLYPMKVKPNDLVDILNTVYVKPGEFYYTQDRRVISLIENKRLDAYLFKF